MCFRSNSLAFEIIDISTPLSFSTISYRYRFREKNESENGLAFYRSFSTVFIPSRHLVRHPASFLSPLMPPPPPHPFSAEGVEAGASSPYSSYASLDTDQHSGYCTSTRVFHSMHAPSFSPSSDVSFVFPAFALFFLPNLLPLPTITTASRPTLVDAGTGESVLLLAFLRACRRGGHDDAYHA